MTTHRRKAWAWAEVGLFLVATTGGCAAMRRDEALQAERTLAAAGFQMKFADTPDKLAKLEGIKPQRQLVPQPYDGQTRFVYADAEYCKCLYAGTPKAYERYQRLAVQQSLAQDQLAAAEANEAASMDWGMWGGWGPWW
jgi:hypothetical protein